MLSSKKIIVTKRSLDKKRRVAMINKELKNKINNVVAINRYKNIFRLFKKSKDKVTLNSNYRILASNIGKLSKIYKRMKVSRLRCKMDNMYNKLSITL